MESEISNRVRKKVLITYSNLFEVNLYDQHNNKVQISQLSIRIYNVLWRN